VTTGIEIRCGSRFDHRPEAHLFDLAWLLLALVLHTGAVDNQRQSTRYRTRLSDRTVK
jgi:hypothetical protein